MKTDYEVLFQDPQFRKELAIEGFVLEASEVIARAMKEKQVSRADLARRLGKSRAWITQVLSGRANLTLRTLAEIAWSLGVELRLQEAAPAAESRARSGASVWSYGAWDSANTNAFATYTAPMSPPEAAAPSQEYAA